MLNILNSMRGKQYKTRLLNPRDQLFDFLLGINTFGYKHYSYNRKDPVWKADYEPCRYKDLFKLLRYADVGPETVFVDFGCGLGRVVFAANHLKASKSIGVEFDKDLYQAAENNRLKSKPLDNIMFAHQDAASFDIPDNANVFCFFNPFGEKTMADTIKNIETSISLYPRKVFIIYYMPLFDNALRCSNVFKIKEEWSTNKMRYPTQFWGN